MNPRDDLLQMLTSMVRAPASGDYDQSGGSMPMQIPRSTVNAAPYAGVGQSRYDDALLDEMNYYNKQATEKWNDKYPTEFFYTPQMRSDARAKGLSDYRRDMVRAIGLESANDPTFTQLDQMHAARVQRDINASSEFQRLFQNAIKNKLPILPGDGVSPYAAERHRAADADRLMQEAANRAQQEAVMRARSQLPQQYVADPNDGYGYYSDQP